jgi:S-adenosylmethionine decarboxylase
LKLDLTSQNASPVTVQTAIPGLHIIANLSAIPLSDALIEFAEFKKFINEQISTYNLSKVGEVYHNFPGGGFTAVVCLTESHLSIHTWPEQNYLTFDIFLSNYLKDNRATTNAIYANVKKFFNAQILLEQLIER